MLRRLVLLGLCVPLIALSAQPQQQTWLIKTDLWGNTAYQTLILERTGDVVTGVFDGDKAVGTRRGEALNLTVTDSNQAKHHLKATVRGDKIIGMADDPDPNNPDKRASHSLTGQRLPDRPSGPPQVHEFIAKDYANAFSASRAPVLTVWPGDSIHTQTIDSGGVDSHGVTVALFGNPQVGP
ncbi:MAG: hypothetical protein ABI268_11415, partial [Rhodanobacter sp.]